MKFIISIIIFMSASQVMAKKGLSVQGLLGFQNGAANIGADVDMHISQTRNVGGYFLLGTEKSNIRNQFWSLGADAKVFFGPKAWRLYLAPGLGLASFDVNGDSEITLGTIFKAGALLGISKGMVLGLEYMIYNNWFTDTAPGGFVLTNLVLRVDL